MGLGRPAWQEARATLQKILSKDEVCVFLINIYILFFFRRSFGLWVSVIHSHT